MRRLFIHGHSWVEPDMKVSFLSTARDRKPFDSHVLAWAIVWLFNCLYTIELQHFIEVSV
jgi:hypothetical protein